MAIENKLQFQFHFRHMGRAGDYFPMAMVILCGRSQVRASAVAL